MPTFSYIATSNDGRTITGSADLTDKSAVISMLVEQGLRPISVKEKAIQMPSFSLHSLFNSKKVKPDNLVMFTRELSAMVGAGVPLLRSLTSLEEYSEDVVLKSALKDIIRDIEGGASLADALKKHPDIFNDVYVNMVRAGEAAGILDGILRRLALQQEKSSSMRKKIKSSMAYPAVLVVITILAFFGLMLFVIPQIGNTLKELGGPDAQLPALTRAMLAISDFIVGYWFIIIPVIIVLIFLITRYLKTPRGKRQLYQIILEIPAIKTIATKIAVAQFARTFSVLMGAGVAVLESLDVTSSSIGNIIYRDAVAKAAEDVKNGKQLSQVIAGNPLFPPIVSQMLAVGEETGQTDKVLVKIADFYDEEVGVAISSISSIIEPVMIVVMGGMVGLIAASVMMPIAGLAQNIQE